MKKDLGDFTLNELVSICDRHPFCQGDDNDGFGRCPLFVDERCINPMIKDVTTPIKLKYEIEYNTED